MTVKEIEAIIPIAVARFKKRIPQSASIIDRTSIRIATAKTKEQLFYSTIEELDAPYKEYLPRTSGEVIIGNKGMAVLLFQFAIKTEDECMRIIWHELGHVLSGVDNKAISTEAEVAIRLDVQSAFTFGISAWTEFIAEAIANYVEDDYREQFNTEFSQFRLRKLAAASYPKGSVSLYHLGLYLAELFTNPAAQIVLDGGYDIGLNQFADSLGQAIIDSAKPFYQQLDENHYFDNMRIWGDGEGVLGDFWKISHSRLEEAGELFYVTADVR